MGREIAFTLCSVLLLARTLYTSKFIVQKYLKLPFIFNNCSPKAERILLNNRLGDYSTIFTESGANSCFSMISRVLSYSV